MEFCIGDIMLNAFLPAIVPLHKAAGADIKSQAWPMLILETHSLFSAAFFLSHSGHKTI